MSEHSFVFLTFGSVPSKNNSDKLKSLFHIHVANFHFFPINLIFVFRNICVKTFLELRRHHKKIILTLEMASLGNEHLPCFVGKLHSTINEFKLRFRMDLNDRLAGEFVNTLIENSTGNWTTTCYDRYQRCCVGIF